MATKVKEVYDLKEDNSLWNKYSIGVFVVWLFDYAERQNDDTYVFCHRVYDELICEFFEEME